MSNDHRHEHEALQQAPRQPNPESIIRTQTNELNRINDNRIFLLSLIDELQGDLNKANLEIASLKERLEQYENDKPSMATIPPSNGDGPGV